jgi:DNA-directed RNA polymerase specialized sigma24 family protein
MGRPRLKYLKQVARNTAADSYIAKKRRLSTVTDGKLPTNQGIEGGGAEEEEEQEQEEQEQEQEQEQEDLSQSDTNF